MLVAVVAEVLGGVAVLLAALLVVGVLVTVRLVARGRPSQPKPVRHPVSRVQGRNLRAWQGSVLREIRRGGHRH